MTPQYGFTGNVALSVSGLPNGVTAIWATNPTTSNSSLYLYPTSSVTPGQYPLTITGTFGSLTKTATLNLTVVAPTFTLSSYGTVTMGVGATSTAWVDVNRSYNFPGSVTLLASGVPSGVTVSFSPSSLTGTGYNSTMTIHTDASTAPGQYTITITGVSGSQTATTPLTLIVNTGTFTLSSSSSVVGQGLSGTGYVYLNELYGFTGAVTLSASGLPSGVTASFSPNPTTALFQPGYVQRKQQRCRWPISHNDHWHFRLPDTKYLYGIDCWGTILHALGISIDGWAGAVFSDVRLCK